VFQQIITRDFTAEPINSGPVQRTGFQGLNKKAKIIYDSGFQDRKNMRDCQKKDVN